MKNAILHIRILFAELAAFHAVAAYEAAKKDAANASAACQH
jgi:hypothetical protein